MTNHADSHMRLGEDGAAPPIRCVETRRAEYTPLARADEFIVPLLRAWIETELQRALPADGRRRRLLDVGCGRQPFRALIESLGAEYVGVDVQQNGEGTVAFLAPIDDPLPPELASSGPFDVVLCTEVLEHVGRWDAACANLAALTKPGGALIVTCPQVYPLHEEPHDFWRATSYALDQSFRRAGLVPERIDRLGDAWDVLGGLLGSMYPIPRAYTLPNRILGRLARASLLGLVFPLLRGRSLQRRLVAGGNVYLANAAVLRKPV